MALSKPLLSVSIFCPKREIRPHPRAVVKAKDRTKTASIAPGTQKTFHQFSPYLCPFSLPTHRRRPLGTWVVNCKITGISTKEDRSYTDDFGLFKCTYSCVS
jgi:hypothetical protein